MTDSSQDAEDYVRASAAALGIPLDDAALPGVAEQLRRTAGLAALVMDFALPDDRQPAPTFRP